MSKNYNKFFNKAEWKPVQTEEPVGPLHEEAPGHEQEPKPEIIPDSSPESKPTEPTIAKVISPSGLNVRKTPSSNGDVLCILKTGSKVSIEELGDEWAHIYTSSGIEGYVRVEFIKEG